MKFSLENRPADRAESDVDVGRAKRATKRTQAPLPGENTRARVDESGTSANAYLKTAAKAKDGENFRREAYLIENAILTMGHKSPSVMRRYAAALYKSGEYRASWMIIADPVASQDKGVDFVSRLKSKLADKQSEGFAQITTFS